MGCVSCSVVRPTNFEDAVTDISNHKYARDWGSRRVQDLERYREAVDAYGRRRAGA